MGISLKEYAGGGRFYTLAEIVDRGAPAREQIASVAKGKFDKLNLTFESGRQCSLNKTSIGLLRAEFGDDTDDLIGKWVIVSAGKSGDFDALLVTPVGTKPVAGKPIMHKAKMPAIGETDDGAWEEDVPPPEELFERDIEEEEPPFVKQHPSRG
jgi:hypothetical protein